MTYVKAAAVAKHTVRAAAVNFILTIVKAFKDKNCEISDCR
jgi:hypothetical protein